LEVETVNFVERIDNVYAIDTNMFDFEHYMSAYIVEGKEVALIDTGLPTQYQALLSGIKGHGFSVNDISFIFVTHSHPDHCGNVGPLLKENPELKVYIHPEGVVNLTDPSLELEVRKRVLPPKMAARIGEMEPIPTERIEILNEGDVFDLGNGEKLKVIFAPGHQPDGIVIFEEKNKGLFINDLVGNFLPDADALYPLNPPLSDHQLGIESLEKILDLPLNYLYLGHYGIIDKPKEVIMRALDGMRQLLDMGKKCISDGKPEEIASKTYDMIMPELEKLRKVRGENVYRYATEEHIATQVKLFAEYCQEKFS
jgi:glyoxylase-like metal-dependent hydrolase (beta-lactamase superfamily II)